MWVLVSMPVGLPLYVLVVAVVLTDYAFLAYYTAQWLGLLMDDTHRVFVVTVIASGILITYLSGLDPVVVLILLAPLIAQFAWVIHMRIAYTCPPQRPPFIIHGLGLPAAPVAGALYLLARVITSPLVSLGVVVPLVGIVVAYPIMTVYLALLEVNNHERPGSYPGLWLLLHEPKTKPQSQLSSTTGEAGSH